jgi:DNA ligase 1
VRFADLVALSARAAALPVRQDKVAEVSAFLSGRSPSDAAIIAELLVRTTLFAAPEDVIAHHDPVHRDASHDDVEPVGHSSLTCDQVADALAQIIRTSAVSLRRSLGNRLLAQATSDEQRWIRAAIENAELDRATFDLIVTSVARSAQVPVRDVRRAATLSGSLPLATRIAFERGEAGLQSVAFEPGRPIPPTVPEIGETPNVLLDPPWPAILEWNVHADRVQAHRRHGTVIVYDQQLRDVTDLVPAVVEQVATLPRGDLVLDGWADIVPGDQSHARVGASWTRRGRAGLAAGRALFFDVLFDGAPVVDEPLSSRRELLESILPENSILPTLPFGDLDDIASTLNEAVVQGHDGLILKSLADPYEGGLAKSSWRLIRGADAVRLAVIAAERGTGDRAHLLSTVHLAALDDRDRLRQVAKTARGLTADQIVWQTGVFAGLVLDGGEGGSGGLFRLRPDVVAVVTIDGVDEGGRDDADLRLRRPRILGYEQNGVATATTVQHLRDIARRDRELQTGPALPRLPPATTPAPVDVDRLGAARSGTERTEQPGGQAATARASPLATQPQRLPARSAVRAVAGANFSPYREPELATSRWPLVAVVATRLAALAWVAAVLMSGLLERSDSASVDGSRVLLIGRFGLVVVGALAITGWAWTDQLVRNTIRLDGRRPSRSRCLSAWLAPLIATSVLAVVVVPLEPTQPADIRPVIIVGVFALAMWRPYSLVRRILTTLTQLRSDALIASAYIIDALAFGLMWWRLTLWGQRRDDLSRGEVDVLVGTLSAVTVAMVVGFVVWLFLLRAATNALAHRRTSQRTRYEHRMLRLSGVDPSDPEIWWALVQRRADEHRAAEESRTPGAAADHRGLPTVETLLETTRSEHSLAFRRLGADESALLEDRLREEFSAIVGVAADARVGEILDLPPPRPPATGPDTDRVPAPPLPAHARDDSSAADSAWDPVLALRKSSGALRGRTVEPAASNKPTTSDIQTLIQRAGSLQIEAALAEHRKKVEERLQDHLVPPTLYLIEAVRLVMVATFAALALVNGWMVVIALSADVADSGALTADAVSDLNLARRVFWGLFTAGSALAPIWSVVILRKARQAGVEVAHEARVRILAAVAGAACIGGFVFDGDERGGLTLVLAVVIVWSSVSAGLSVEPVRVWYGLPAWTLTSWIATLPLILGIAWIAGMSAAFEPSASLQRLAFTTILLCFGCARVTVIALLSSLDLEDKFRTSPELAVPARRRGR